MSKQRRQPFPPQLLPFQTEALAALKKGCAVEIEFSGPTYQVLVDLGKKEEEGQWVFLQLEEKGGVRDFFCNCSEAEEKGGCLHQAVSFARIYQGSSYPLHERLERSLEQAICRNIAMTVGYESNPIEEESSTRYTLRSSGGKLLFSIDFKNDALREKFLTLLHSPHKETEASSLKFSNLSEEEITLWREGRPNPELRFRLSVWADLAKELFFLIEKGERLTVDFRFSEDELPNYFLLKLDSCHLEVYVARANLPLMIPHLKGAASPLKVFGSESDPIEAIVFHPERREFEICRSRGGRGTLSRRGEGRTIPLEGWMYEVGVGFYREEIADGWQRVIQEEEIAAFLKERSDFIKEHLVDYTLYDHPVELSYGLSFDEEWNLWIKAYLFEEGDLAHEGCALFGSYLFVPGDGFYLLHEPFFPTLIEMVAEKKVADFIGQHRYFLSNCVGYQPFLKTIEQTLQYKVEEDGSLLFLAKQNHALFGKSYHEFGGWVYLPQEGFYSKRHSFGLFEIRPGVVIPRHKVDGFIRANQSDLTDIDGFFCSSSPIIRADLIVERRGDSALYIQPSYQIQEGIEEGQVFFYHEYLFWREEGFVRLPQHASSISSYLQPKLIEKEELELFFQYEWKELLPFLRIQDHSITIPKQLNLLIEDFSSEKESSDAFFLSLFYESEFGKESLYAMKQRLDQGRGYMFSKAGLLLFEGERWGWLKLLSLKRIDDQNRLCLSGLELVRLIALEKPKFSDQAPKELFNLWFPEKLSDQKERAIDLTLYRGELRSYQQKGVQWLASLHALGFSALLCDEMGLGKTHQTMAFMASLSRSLASPFKAIVIAPTSVIYHWEDKVREYLPTMNRLLYYGSKRSLAREKDDRPLIIITSYAIARRDILELRKEDFDLAVLDELQLAKNHASRLFKALTQLKSTMRLGLTGTPFENHLRELKTLFDLILPGYMPKESHFCEAFLKPIEKQNDQERRELLQRLIAPFILRRRKESVLKELPPKCEEILRCDLTHQQANFYNICLKKGRALIEKEIETTEKQVSYVHIFSLLSSLKQICNHPACYLKQPQEYQKYTSGKWQLFCEILKEALDSGQKVVVFSQYLAMLDILALYLEENQIGFCQLRGATRDRDAQFRLFREDREKKVFLASLGAVAYGVDLTQASVVIHYDRWWNAAKEDQATDRVHRIGQEKNVQVFKFVTRRTFEERIEILINDKRELLEGVLQEDSPDLLKRLDQDELMKLLELVEGEEEAIDEALEVE